MRRSRRPTTARPRARCRGSRLSSPTARRRWRSSGCSASPRRPKENGRGAAAATGAARAAASATARRRGPVPARATAAAPAHRRRGPAPETARARGVEAVGRRRGRGHVRGAEAAHRRPVRRRPARGRRAASGPRAATGAASIAPRGRRRRAAAVRRRDGATAAARRLAARRGAAGVRRRDDGAAVHRHAARRRDGAGVALRHAGRRPRATARHRVVRHRVVRRRPNVAATLMLWKTIRGGGPNSFGLLYYLILASPGRAINALPSRVYHSRKSRRAAGQFPCTKVRDYSAPDPHVYTKEPK